MHNVIEFLYFSQWLAIMSQLFIFVQVVNILLFMGALKKQKIKKSMSAPISSRFDISALWGSSCQIHKDTDSFTLLLPSVAKTTGVEKKYLQLRFCQISMINVCKNLLSKLKINKKGKTMATASFKDHSPVSPWWTFGGSCPLEQSWSHILPNVCQLICLTCSSV